MKAVIFDMYGAGMKCVLSWVKNTFLNAQIKPDLVIDNFTQNSYV